MKKLFLIMFLVMCIPLKAAAFDVSTSFYIDDNDSITMTNIWEKMGKQEQKILEIGGKILDANKINRRVNFTYLSSKMINVSTANTNKTITVYRGIMHYVDNDDEMASILSHEIAHAMDAYGGLGKWTAMLFNGKHYEKKADLIGIDYMVKAGYNPVAAIIIASKLFDENQYNFGFKYRHPRGSERMFAMYKYIYLKYPSYLNSSMVNNTYYRIFTRVCARDIAAFKEEQTKKKAKGVKIENF